MKNKQIHPCSCTSYNGGQCYNCLNGAHSTCSSKNKCKGRYTGIGLPIVVVNQGRKK